MQAVCAKCSRLMCRAVVLFLVAECAQTTPMIAPLPGDPNFSIDGSVAFFKSGESNPTQPNPPTGPQATGAPAPTPRGRGDGPPSPRPREEPEHGPPPRPRHWLPQELQGTSEPAPTRQDAAQIAPREGGRSRTGVVWGPRPP